MINVQNLSKIYKTEDVQTNALNNISLHIKEGEFVAIMGPSGCGKSTFLNILGLLDDASTGSYKFAEVETVKAGEKKKSAIRKKNIGFIFQNFNLIDELSVYENIELPLIYNGVSSSERKRRVEEIMEQINIGHRAKHYPQQLSGGQQQRAAVARALVTKPQLILADEPTGNLDSSNGNEVMNLLAELHREGSTIVMVTHSSYDAGFASRIVNMKDGEIFNEEHASQRRDVFEKADAQELQ
ncbi:MULTISPECIES: ABC transporter ATP-binding protein [unclassified Chryseobacterium]|uniref:ABC transporter ATP-binding protein n=1 Tax=unclassified Chryseobacterium TaxID=2593645 RepID=UPI0004E6C220|nr:MULTISPECIES: ABC transporter ATP-binding protein [unclassified Chryseobacterium]KFF19567.1 phosphonate ABC transporter ATP-binding protein [Chryseobacterium sp. JM1]SHF84190.1 putative ABC transport system ATP-binding protein [Chryseobacterium sp. OV279]